MHKSLHACKEARYVYGSAPSRIVEKAFQQYILPLERTNSTLLPTQYHISYSSLLQLLSTPTEIRLGQWDRASQVLERRADLRSNESQRFNSWSENTIEGARQTPSRKLVEQARSIRSTDTGRDLAVLDRAKADGIKRARRSVAAEKDRVEEVHLQDLGGDIVVGVWADAIDPVVRDLLSSKAPGAIAVVLRAEEAGDGFQVWLVAVVSVWHELVQEAGCSVQEEGKWSEVEVLVLGQRLIVALEAIECQSVEVEVAVTGVVHHSKERAVEGEVVSVVEEEVVASQRRIGFELVVAIETRLASGESWAERCTCGSIATNGKLLGHNITVGESETERSEQHCEVVANVVHVLLRVDELAESSDTIVSKEVVVGRCVQSRAGSTNIVWTRSDELMRSVAL